MDSFILRRYFWLNLCFIIFHTINVAYAEGWKITHPKENMIVKENTSLAVCWEGVKQPETNFIVTLNKLDEDNFINGVILGDNISSSSTCFNYEINNLNKKIENGLKTVILWDSNRKMITKSPHFSLNRSNSSNFNFSSISYIIIGVAVIVPIVFVLYTNYKKKAAETIPMGSRSIPSLTVNRRKTYEPPIKSYRESWIELPQANISADSIEDMYGYDLLEEAEEAAKSMGLLDKVWIAKKSFTPCRDDELLIRVGDELIVREIYDDLWCYGQNKTLFDEKEKNENRKIEYNINLSVQENEEIAMYGMFPSVVLPIEFKNLKVTKATIQSIREASVVAEPIHDDIQDEDVVLKQDPNSVVIKIPSPPENMILPLNNLKRSTSLRSSLHRRATQRSTNLSLVSQPLSSIPVQPLPAMPVLTNDINI
ncbi:hypothetical protein BCR36DRAFT_586169 [Piromyces finnis]|uniref:SH3 domain-containing protein n=1 Tax=Piromyces finnis TaxID=1754191 RepID=A0A1Y1V228_9FUNG|nr:hypothetical protein BCR36DRAFT_586169 [Piromyces finnis]|eukprot:ORX44299.1 hypothetical protein BCR36DRAFT_586169 [Piromyces finnis]